MNGRAKLVDFLDSAFDKEELDGICFELGVSFENLSGSTRTAKCRSFVKQLLKEGRLLELKEVILKKRPQRKEEIQELFSTLAPPPPFPPKKPIRKILINISVVVVGLFFLFQFTNFPYLASSTATPTPTPTTSATATFTSEATSTITATITVSPPPPTCPPAPLVQELENDGRVQITVQDYDCNSPKILRVSISWNGIEDGRLIPGVLSQGSHSYLFANLACIREELSPVGGKTCELNLGQPDETYEIVVLHIIEADSAIIAKLVAPLPLAELNELLESGTITREASVTITPP